MLVVLAQVAACIFLTKFYNERKATAKYVMSLGDEKSSAKVSKTERKSGLGKDASNSILESLHRGLTYRIQLYRTARIDYLAAEGQSRYNNDMGQGHEAIITDQRAKNCTNLKAIGAFHLLQQELQRSLILTGKENTKVVRKEFDRALSRQRGVGREKERVMLEKKSDDTQEDYITAIYFWEQYHAPCC